ncbi:MAG: alpha/beta hydrolase [Chloroflexi bacterium]|nr:alpha/beta hydrolase [Chloroflexota bacterium]
MKKFFLTISCVGLLVISGCASPASTPTPVAATALPRQTATSIPPSETPAPELSKPPTFNVPYVSDGNQLQRLDVFLPEGEDGPFPTIFAIYGGGFTSGTQASYYDLAIHFNEIGYALVTINYRVAPEFNYPAHVQDAFCALAWVHANAATYGFDTERIIALGDSSGGYLVAMLGTVDTPSLYLEGCPNPLPQTDWIQGVVAFYGGYDFTSIDGLTEDLIKNAYEPFWGTTFDKVPAETLAEMSPISWVDGSEPPFLIINGTNDVTTPSWAAEDFASALEDSGATVELLLVDAGHGFINATFLPAYVQALETVDAWLAAMFES